MLYGKQVCLTKACLILRNSLAARGSSGQAHHEMKSEDMTEQTQHSPLEEHELHRLTPANILPKQVFKQGSAGSVSGSDMRNCLNNLEISTNSLPIKCFLKKVGGVENNSRVKVVVQNNFRFWSHENASPFLYSQTTR